jgi:hypothetical protein
MGGPGSGNRYHWHRPTKKTTVEDGLSIDANRWMHEGILRAGVRRSGTWTWTYPRRGKFSVNYEVSTLDLSRPFVCLSYAWTWAGSKEPQSARYAVELTTTHPRFGGLRWWFVCPLLRRGVPCYRRVGKLYLPPQARYFGCRQCHDLTYRSVQQHDKRVDLLRKNPAALLAMMEDSNALGLSELCLVLKAAIR